MSIIIAHHHSSSSLSLNDIFHHPGFLHGGAVHHTPNHWME